jgi:hypothetical protein
VRIVLTNKKEVSKMTKAQMILYIRKHGYTHMYGKGGVRIPVDKLPDKQLVACYYRMLNKNTKPKPLYKVEKGGQVAFNF